MACCWEHASFGKHMRIFSLRHLIVGWVSEIPSLLIYHTKSETVLISFARCQDPRLFTKSGSIQSELLEKRNPVNTLKGTT